MTPSTPKSDAADEKMAPSEDVARRMTTDS
jgi:hypothetical protein